MFDIDYYVTKEGYCPIMDFFSTLDDKMRAKCFRLLELLEKNGNELREPYSKYLGSGLFELRVKQSSNVIRIVYFFVIEHRIIITNGFVKKTLKTPRRDIELAKKYREDFLLREER